MLKADFEKRRAEYYGALEDSIFAPPDEGSATMADWIKHCRDEYSDTIHKDIVAKLDVICDKYQDYPSYQHAAWIIEEEYREFCAELFKKDSEWDYTKIYKELIDIMAACYRTIIDRDLLSHVKTSAETTEVV